MRFDYPDLEAALAGLASEVPANLGLGGHFAALAGEHPDRLAIVDGDDRRTFGEVEAAASRLARVLLASGVTTGGRVALVLPNSADFVTLAIATWKVGAAVVPISYRMPEIERTALVQLAQPTLVIDSVAEYVAAADAESDAPIADVVAAPWKIIGSGGSTGLPKLIVDPGAGPMRRSVARMFGMRPGGVELVAGPLYHNGPFAWSFIQLMAGGTIVLAGRFDPARYLATIERERVTWSFVVPTMLHRIDSLRPAERDNYDLSSLEVVLVSAAPCPSWLKRRAVEFFGPDRLWEFYGASEVPGTMIRGDDWLEHPESVGRALPGVQIFIRDEDGHAVADGEVGEIWIQPPGGPTFRYEGAEERINGRAVSVGDLGWLDGDGYLHISDRRTDLIITGGANVYPAEVEGAILEHPDVLDVAVIGLSDPDWGQAVHAIVAIGPDAGVAEGALAAFCRTRLAAYKLPKSFEIVDELPRDPSGKLRRSALRDEREASRRRARSSAFGAANAICSPSPRAIGVRVARRAMFKRRRSRLAVR